MNYALIWKPFMQMLASRLEIIFPAVWCGMLCNPKYLTIVTLQQWKKTSSGKKQRKIESFIRDKLRYFNGTFCDRRDNYSRCFWLLLHNHAIYHARKILIDYAHLHKLINCIMFSINLSARKVSGGSCRLSSMKLQSKAQTIEKLENWAK